MTKHIERAYAHNYNAARTAFAVRYKHFINATDLFTRPANY